MRTASRLLFLGALCLVCTAPLWAGDIPTAKPEDVGLSSAQLDRIGPIVEEHIKEHRAAGVLTLVARKGKVADLRVFGMMDLEAGKPMKENTIFRIYSMSKPMTTVAAMILWEEGRFQLDDPVFKFLPEFKNLRVQAEGKSTEELKHPVTV